MRRRSRTSHGSNEMRQRAIRRAPRGANPGTTDPPRCGHATPRPSPPLVATAMHMFRFFEVFLGLLRVVRLLQARRHEAQAYVHPRQAHTKSKLKPRTTKH